MAVTLPYHMIIEQKIPTMKWITMTLIVLLSYTGLQAQRGNEKRERLKALKTAFITEELALTSSQAEQFWPIYNELEQELKTIRRQRRQQDPASLNEAETEAWVLQQLDLEAQQVETKRRYINRFSTVLNWQQIAKLLRVENRFKQELLRRMRERRPEGRR